MLEKVKDKINPISKAAGLEITILPDSSYRIALVLLSLEKKQVRIIKRQQWKSASLDILKDQLERDIPVNLVLNGKGILHKRLQEAGRDPKTIIQSILPNARADDFYMQDFNADKNSLVSIVRRDQVDRLLEELQELQLSYTSLNLAAVTVGSVVSILEDTAGHSNFIWSGHQLELDPSGSIADYKYTGNTENGKSFQLGTEKLEENYLTAYSAAFCFLLKNEPVIPFVEKVVKSKEEFMNGHLFRKLGWAVLGFFLVVLMINFMLFANYSSRNNELLQKESRYSSLLSEMDQLDKEVKEKKTFLSEAGWLRSSFATYYGDRLAATVPSSVRLTELSVNPTDDRRSKEEKKEVFTTGTIIMKGECTKPTELNEWLDKIKSIEKVDKAKLVHYSYDNKINKGAFSIEIKTN